MIPQRRGDRARVSDDRPCQRQMASGGMGDGVLMAVAAVIFVVVYEQTGPSCGADRQDVAGDVAQLSRPCTACTPSSPRRCWGKGAYLRPALRTGVSLLFASIPGHGTRATRPAGRPRTPRQRDGEDRPEKHGPGLPAAHGSDSAGGRRRHRPVSTSAWCGRLLRASGSGPGSRWPSSPGRAQHRRGPSCSRRPGARAGAGRLLSRRGVGLLAAATARRVAARVATVTVPAWTPADRRRRDPGAG